MIVTILMLFASTAVFANGLTQTPPQCDMTKLTKEIQDLKAEGKRTNNAEMLTAASECQQMMSGQGDHVCECLHIFKSRKLKKNYKCLFHSTRAWTLYDYKLACNRAEKFQAAKAANKIGKGCGRHKNQQRCEAKFCKWDGTNCVKDRNVIDIKAVGAGAHGAQGADCTCPDGSTYLAANIKGSNCQQVACNGGVAGACTHITQPSFTEVTCHQECSTVTDPTACAAQIGCGYNADTGCGECAAKTGMKAECRAMDGCTYRRGRNGQCK